MEVEKENDDGVVHKLETKDSRQISTSQVVVSLMGACRELIDNALDAHATSIGKFLMN
jgi:DNA mismatch repair ATPase MutL